MNNSAFRFNEKNATDVPMVQGTFSLPEEATARQSSSPAFADLQVNIQPLLTLQRLSLERKTATCICENFRQAQRYFSECLKHQVTGATPPVLVHEMMPAHQQDYLINCLNASRDFAVASAIVIFTTRSFYEELVRRAPWLHDSADIVTTDDGAPCRFSPPCDSAAASEPAVSCICLRTGAGGKWVLMDHEAAASLRYDHAPDTELVPRLLRHTVEISGNRLAPYLAMMFDVPEAWKVHPALATRSLLIFDKYVCALGCSQPGIPQRIIWSDMLGIVY